MKASYLLPSAIIIFLTLFIVSCKEKAPHFTVQGKITNADTAYLYLEKKSLTETIVLDSVRLRNDGEYFFEQPAPQYPEFYSLKLKGQSINFAVDSTENININTSASTFATEYSISGSESSSKIREITLNQYQLTNTLYILRTELNNKQITQNTYLEKINEAIDNYKTAVEQIISSDYTSMAAYYALFQKVQGYLIFDPYSKKDLRLFQTVATVWKQRHAEEPRAQHLEKYTLQILSEVRSIEKQNQMLDSLGNQATVVGSVDFYNITLPDIQNKPISLHDLKGKVVILDFTAYQTDYSPAHNILINKAYEKNKSQVDVYQVSFDSDPHVWRNSAVNLPWKCVRDSKSLQSELIQRYNIQNLPTTFILNKQGEIVKRLSESDNIEAEVKKIL